MADRSLGMPATITRSAAFLFEQLNGQLGNGLVGGALAHADQHRTVTDGHDVPPFQGGRAVVDGGIAPPDVQNSASTKSGWNL